jgi:hypothetical protein
MGGINNIVAVCGSGLIADAAAAALRNSATREHITAEMLPHRLGHAEAPLSTADVNQLPHPFAA